MNRGAGDVTGSPQFFAIRHSTTFTVMTAFFLL